MRKAISDMASNQLELLGRDIDLFFFVFTSAIYLI